MTITLKDIPAGLHRKLKSQAKAHGRSLNKEVVHCLQVAILKEDRSTVEEIIARSRKLRAGMRFEATAEEIQRFKEEGRN